MAEYIPAAVIYACAALVIFALCNELMAERIVAVLVAVLWLPFFAFMLIAFVSAPPIIKLAERLRGGVGDERTRVKGKNNSAHSLSSGND